jgi:hypothetical protein
MRTWILILAAASALAAGCTSTGRPQAGPGAERVGAPQARFDLGIARKHPPDGGGEDNAAVRLPDRIALPASYRLVLLDGHLELVREADPQAILQAPATMRMVAGEIARGELAYQPGLLPQELAAEVAANRESSARMDNALEDVMRRSRELSEQALALQAQSRRLAELLAASEARVRELEGAGRASPAREGQAPAPRAQDNN